MKIRITLKDPDGVSDSIRRAIVNSGVPESRRPGDCEFEEKEEEINKAISKFVEYSEYVRIEIDTEAGTAIVLPV